MTSNINPNQFNAIATDIVKLLDNKEADQSTRNDGKIEASIWNAFVGKDADENERVGNGDKSCILKAIYYQNAISSIISYIKTKGIDRIVNTLKTMGIDFDINKYQQESKEASEADENQADENAQKPYSFDLSRLTSGTKNNNDASSDTVVPSLEPKPATAQVPSDSSNANVQAYNNILSFVSNAVGADSNNGIHVSLVNPEKS